MSNDLPKAITEMNTLPDISANDSARLQGFMRMTTTEIKAVGGVGAATALEMIGYIRELENKLARVNTGTGTEKLIDPWNATEDDYRISPASAAPVVDNDALKKRARQIIDAVIESPVIVEVRTFSQPEEVDKLEDRVAALLQKSIPAAATVAPMEQSAIEIADQIVGTVFDNTAASHETLKRTMIERIADYLEGTR